MVAVQSSALEDFNDLTPQMALNMARAINKTTERGRAAAAKLMRTQVGFSASYLSPSSGRLTIDSRANSEDLSASIRGRHRPTSLARFATTARRGQRGARITVQPGLARFLPKAFFVQLRSGNTDTRNNLGLAIRLPEGQRPGRAYKPTELFPGLWLLYGPSVDQVFDDVAEEISPDLADYLGNEFLRLMDLN